MAHATARVLKTNTVEARVKPILTVAGNTFKDLNSNEAARCLRGLAPAGGSACRGPALTHDARRKRQG